MMRFKQVVVVATPLPKIEVGYFSLKNARNSSLKRVTNTAKIAIDTLMSSIVVSLCEIPPLPLKNSKKKPVLKRTGYFTQGLNLFSPTATIGSDKLYQNYAKNQQRV